MPKICPRYVQDIPKICPRYAQDMFKICPRYAENMPKLCPRNDQDMPKILSNLQNNIYLITNMVLRDTSTSKNTSRLPHYLRTNLFLLSEDTMIKNLEILKILKIFLLLLLIKGSLLSEDKRIYWAGLIVASDGLDNWSACENQTETFKTFN